MEDYYTPVIELVKRTENTAAGMQQVAACAQDAVNHIGEQINLLRHQREALVEVVTHYDRLNMILEGAHLDLGIPPRGMLRDVVAVVVTELTQEGKALICLDAVIKGLNGRIKLHVQNPKAVVASILSRHKNLTRMNRNNWKVKT